MNQKYIFKLTFVLLAAFVLVNLPSPALAQEASQETSQSVITSADLGVNEVGILPTSPWYFFKEWGRNIQRFFVFNPIKKAELELKISNEKAAEILKVDEIKKGSEDAIKRAIENYHKAQERLKEQLSKLKESSQNPNVEKLLQDVYEKTALHTEVIESIMAKQFTFADEKLKETLESAQEKIQDVLLEASEKEEINKEKAQEQIEKAEKAIKELKEAYQSFLKDNPVEACLAKCRDQYSGSGSAGFEACVRACTAGSAERTNAACSGDVAPGCPVPTTPVCKDGKWICVSPATGTSGARSTFVVPHILEKYGRAVFVLPHILEKAGIHLSKAKEAFNDEKYGKAFGQARAAEAMAQSGLKILERLALIPEPPNIACPQIAPACPRETCLLSAKQLEEVYKGCQYRQICKSCDQTSVTPGTSRLCTQKYDPVCGLDGKTYSNECFAKLGGTSAAHDGICKNTGFSGSGAFSGGTGTTTSATEEFKIEADDSGFYPSSINVKKGSIVKINFLIKSTGVYQNGLEIISPEFRVAVKPGGTAVVEFTADQSFEMKSYWPDTQVLKATGKVVVE